MPFGLRSRPSTSGSVTGSWSSGTGTIRPSSVWIIGMGVPQKRWREISQSRRRKVLAARPVPAAVSCSMTRAIALRLDRPSSGPELIIRPSPVRAMPVRAGSIDSNGRPRSGSIGTPCSSSSMTGIAPVTGAVVSTTTVTGRSNARAKSRSRWSCAGTAMTAPCP